MKDRIKWKNLIVLLIIITVLIIGCVYIYINYSNIKDKNIYPQENDQDALVFEAKDLIFNDNIDLRTNFSNKKLEYNKILDLANKISIALNFNVFYKKLAEVFKDEHISAWYNKYKIEKIKEHQKNEK